MTTTKITKQLEREFNHIRVRGQKLKTYISDLTVTTRGRIVNNKKRQHFTEDDLISFTSNSMFLTMLSNEQYKFIVCKLLSECTFYDYEYLMENAHFYKNEMNKDSVKTKEEKGDLLIKMGDKFYVIEMDMRNELERNVEYTDRVYRYKSIKGEKEKIYPEILYIGFENFSYEEIEEAILVFHMQTDEGICLLPRTYMIVLLPKLLKKWYDKEVDEELKGFYKTILTMYETSMKRAMEYAKGDAKMEKYKE